MEFASGRCSRRLVFTQEMQCSIRLLKKWFNICRTIGLAPVWWGMRDGGASDSQAGFTIRATAAPLMLQFGALHVERAAKYLLTQ